MKLAERLIARATRREPDFVIGGTERPYLRRWWLLPRNRLFNVYLHQFLRSDDDRALHDHPWMFNASRILRGEYLEHTIAEGGIEFANLREAGDWKFRWGRAPHRIQLPMVDYARTQPGDYALIPCWTLFITGPVVRSWGFHCPQRGWVPWQRFTAADDKGAIGKGCDA